MGETGHWDKGDAVLIYGIILIFQSCPRIQRDVSLLEMPAAAVRIGAKGTAGKKLLIKSGGVKGSIA